MDSTKRTKEEKAAELKRAFEIIEQFRGKRIYARVNNVSRSGMSRRIEYYAVTNDGEIMRIGYYIAQILNSSYNVDKGGLLVGGVGMDMIFSVLSNFNYTMAKHDTGKSITELLKTKQCGERIYDNYFIDADNYKIL